MNDTVYFPKVLLLDFSFDNTTGMGVTLTNLFKDWPVDRVGVMSDRVNPDLCNSIRPCSSYIGVSKSISVQTNKAKARVIAPQNRVRKVIRNVYHRLGIDELNYKPYIHPHNIEAMKSFAPDIVFCGLGNLNRMKLCMKIHELLPKSKVVLYIVDDWVNSRVSEKWPSFIWKQRYDKAFRKILSFSSGNVSICQEMSDAYKERYGVRFVPFHNPVDVSFWESLCPPKKYGPDTVSLLYVGKINADTEDCLIDCCKIVESLNKEGKSIRFDVYSPDYQLKHNLFDKYKNCSLFPPIPHEEIPNLTKSYTSLFLTLGFSRHSVKYVKLSMPTKLSEYLASGLPVVLYCSNEIALYHYIYAMDCAFTCCMRTEDKLKQTILRLFDERDSSRVVSNALAVANKHDVGIVRTAFLDTLKSFDQTEGF